MRSMQVEEPFTINAAISNFSPGQLSKSGYPPESRNALPRRVYAQPRRRRRIRSAFFLLASVLFIFATHHTPWMTTGRQLRNHQNSGVSRTDWLVVQEDEWKSEQRGKHAKQTGWREVVRKKFHFDSSHPSLALKILFAVGLGTHR